MNSKYKNNIFDLTENKIEDNVGNCLSKSKKGLCSCIAQIDLDELTHGRLLSMGLNNGQDIEVLRNRGGDVVIKTKCGYFTLGGAIAEKIKLQEK